MLNARLRNRLTKKNSLLLVNVETSFSEDAPVPATRLISSFLGMPQNSDLLLPHKWSTKRSTSIYFRVVVLDDRLRRAAIGCDLVFDKFIDDLRNSYSGIDDEHDLTKWFGLLISLVF